MSDEPEVQHRDECEHPIAPCTCPRDDLLSEARRIREMCLFAEGEFARENRRAVDLKIERDRMQRALDDWERVVTEKALLDAGKVAWYEAVVPALEAERDRLQAAVDAALKLADAKIEGEAEREADAWVTLGAALGQLDVSPTGENDDVEALADRVAGLPPTEQVDVLLGMLGKVSDERDRLRTVVWDQSKLRASLAGARFARDEAVTEQNRLRAVVDAVREFRRTEDQHDGDDLTPERLDDAASAWRQVVGLLDQLDVSPTMGGTDSVGGRRLTVAVEPTDHRGAGDATPGTPSETSAMGRSEDDPTDVVTAAITSHYVSTYCIHADHERCRLVCKTCDAPCRCHCHGKDTDAETVGPSARVGETGLAGTGNDAGAGVAEVAGLPDLDPSAGDRATCRWCHRPIIFTSASVLSVIEDAWVHEGPQPGSGHARQLACEPDMQSMLAEPEES